MTTKILSRIGMTLTLIIALCVGYSYAQISFGGNPPTLSYNIERDTRDGSIVHVPIDFDVNAMRADDEILEADGKPPRVGKIIPVNLTMENSGRWTKLPNGQKIWRLTIIAQDAIAMMLTYDKFIIPAGAKLFIYNEDYARVLGAYTEETNPLKIEYATEFVPGDVITLEYVSSVYENDSESPEIEITGVVYGYNHLYAKDGTRMDFGGSEPCEVNVKCPEGNNWTDQRKGVVRLVTPVGGGYYSLCSGAIVNNTSFNLDLLVLSVYHCYDGLTPTQINQTVYYFMYEHSACSGRSNPTVPTITGAPVALLVTVSVPFDGVLYTTV
jgi:hypothetical protein